MAVHQGCDLIVDQREAGHTVRTSGLSGELMSEVNYLLGTVGQSCVHPSPLPLCSPRMRRMVSRTPRNCAWRLGVKVMLSYLSCHREAELGQHVREARPLHSSQCLLALPIPAPFPLRWVGSGRPVEAGPLISHWGSHADCTAGGRGGGEAPGCEWTLPRPCSCGHRSWFRCFHTLQPSHLFKGWSPLPCRPSAQLPVKLVGFAAMQSIQQL